MQSGAFNSVLDKLYEPTTEPHEWASVLTLTSLLFDNAGVLLIFLNRLSLRVTDIFSDDSNTELAAQLRTRFQHHPIAFDNRFACHVISAPVFSVGDTTCILKIFRSSDSSDFARCEVILADHLAPHFERAIRIRYFCASCDPVWSEASTVLDRLTAGVAVLDQAGRPQLLNLRARETIENGDVLIIRDGVLRAVRDDDQSKFWGFLSRATRAGARGVGEAMWLNRATPGHSMTLFARPLSRTNRQVLASPPMVALYLMDSAAIDLPPVSVMMQLYSLTQSEAMLALALMAGRGLQPAAQHLKISPNTAKSHLKQIFEKTGVGHQVELIRLVLSGPGRIRFDNR